MKYLFAASVTIVLSALSANTSPAGGTIPERELFMPIVFTPLSREREWDPRLDERFASVSDAELQPGDNGFWFLEKAVWFDEEESQGRHHIFMDVLDSDGNRMVGVPIRISWPGEGETILTQEKPGEPYAADFAMFATAPAYNANVADGEASDLIRGMGMGSIEEPHLGIHTSYGLTWRWIDTE